MASTFNLNECLDKIDHRDPDFRFMALNDLIPALEKDTFKMDTRQERDLCKKLVLLFGDVSGDVRGLAVKCLNTLISRISNQQVEAMSSGLLDMLLSPTEVSRDKRADGRDIASTGLKAIINHAPIELGPVLVRQLSQRLINCLNKTASTAADKPANEKDEREIQNEKQHSIDVMNDLLARFGGLMGEYHAAIQKAVTPLLLSPQPQPRKRAISSLAHLAGYMPQNLFVSLIEYLLSQAESCDRPDNARTFVQAIGSITESVGQRMAPYVDHAMIVIESHATGDRFLSLRDSMTDAFEGDAELREIAFQGFESLVTMCPKEVTPNIPRILDLSLQFLGHDPNFNEDAGDEFPMDDEEDDFVVSDDEGDADEFQDDEDMNWKVRRACAKTIAAIIATRPELLEEFYNGVAQKLVSRFKEREETVKLEVFQTFSQLLSRTRAANNPKANQALHALVSEIVSALTTQLKDKSIKVRVATFQLLKLVIAVIENAFTGHVGEFVPGITFCLTDKSANSNLRTEALLFLRTLLETHSPEEFHPHFAAMCTPVYTAVNDSFYKITAEALRVCTAFVRILRPTDMSEFNYHPYVKDLFLACNSKLVAQDIDQEVKEAVITCAGAIVANLGDDLAADLPQTLKVLSERLSNEIARLTAVRAIRQIAASPLKLDLSLILNEVTENLALFLRKSNRKLKQASLSALEVLVRNYGQSPAVVSQLPVVIKELAPHVNVADLHLAHLALQLVVAILETNPASALAIKEDVYARALELLESQLLQGLTLESLLALFSAAVRINQAGFDFDFLMASLLKQSGKKLSKQCFGSIAQCIAVTCINASATQRDTVVRQFLQSLRSSKDELFSLQCLGEIGRRADLSNHADIEQAILAAFDSPVEEIKTTASHSLGKLAVGNVQRFLPMILENTTSHPQRQYLLMGSLREMISRSSTSADGIAHLSPLLPQLLPLLFTHCESEDEGSRSVVAECLGKLALVQPEALVPELQARISSDRVHARATVITALKFAIVDHPHPIDGLLKPVMGVCLRRLRDEDLKAGLNVRYQSLLTLNYAAHNKPLLVRDFLRDTLPDVYAECKPHADLVRTIIIGPFKHKVDDGLETRKAAFECLYTLLETCQDCLDVSELISNALSDGLKDEHDVKLLSHLILSRLANCAPLVLLQSLPSLLPALKLTVEKKMKDNAVKQDKDRNDELILSALRSIVSLTKMPGIEACGEFQDFMRTTVHSEEVEPKFNAVLDAEKGSEDIGTQ